MAGRLKALVCGVLAVGLVSLAFVCLGSRTQQRACGSDVLLAAAALSMPDGRYTENEKNSVESDPGDTDAKAVARTRDFSSYDEAVFSEDPAVYADEEHFPVVETLYSTGELGYNDFYVKNISDYDPDIGSFLTRPLGFDFEDSDKVQVLIVHTHTTESFLSYDAGYYHESFYARSTDPELNMNRVGRAIEEGLREQGIGVVHAQEIHDSPEYDGAYYRSYDTIMKYIEKYPDIKVVLDIHRDSIGYGSENGKVKPTFTHNGKKAAQIMILAGYDGDGSLEFPNWEDNLTFALKLQDTAEKMYPGMTRPLYLGNFVYNMNVNTGSLLIEVGTDANTFSEVVYTGELLSNVLTRVLQSG